MFELIRGCHLIQIFQLFRRIISHSTILFQRCFSFQWALTHRSFPRILPDSSKFPGVILKYYSKFDVSMNFISQMLFQDQFQIIFIVGSTFSVFHSPGVFQQFWWCFSLSFEDRRRVLPLNLVSSLEVLWF